MRRARSRDDGDRRTGPRRRRRFRPCRASSAASSASHSASSLDLPAWNYPLLTAVNCVVPAVLAGNAVVVKHSPRSPLCGEHFAAAFAEAGAPAGLVQALHCDHPTSERMVGDARVDHVVFTGSIFGGHRMVEASVEAVPPPEPRARRQRPGVRRA